MGHSASCGWPLRRRLRLAEDGREKLASPLPNPCQLFSGEYPPYGLLPADEEPYEVRFCAHSSAGRCACDDWVESRHWRLVAGLDDWTQPRVIAGLQPRDKRADAGGLLARAGVPAGQLAQLAPGETPPRYALLRGDEMPRAVSACAHVRYAGESACDCDAWAASRAFRLQAGWDDATPGALDAAAPPRKAPTIRVNRRRYTSLSGPSDDATPEGEPQPGAEQTTGKEREKRKEKRGEGRRGGRRRGNERGGRRGGAEAAPAAGVQQLLFASISVSIIASQTRAHASGRDRAGFDSLAEKRGLQRSSTLLEDGFLEEK